MIQIGVKALRSPTGEIIKTVPIYASVDEPTKEETNLKDIAKVFAEKYKAYAKAREV
jgi:hypothetical protein